jgi:hypothetical protein
MTKRTLIIAALAVLGTGGWYAFRPERLFIDQTVNESLGEAALSAGTETAMPATLAMGQFKSIAHETKGTATVLQLADGKRILRLTDFMTSNGPDVRVYLVKAPDAPDNATVSSAGFIELGALKGNVGDQNYEIPASIDLGSFQTVTIWCRRFSVNFGSAPLAKS